MTLAPGTRLGPYEVTALIGAGGMGEVYRATDTYLKRAVAVKVLPAAVAADAERLARFQREAEVLAALNHPHIAAIYGLERSSPTSALVMELVEGPTLADRIAAGPIPRDEALPIARQIAEALEAAHERDIVHRDLKPANIKVRDDGTVKVLDFGLAKALTPDLKIGPTGADADSPTVVGPTFRSGGVAPRTQLGVILGTAAYMSPEQSRGRTVDRRADLWAFGVVLYEMLTGKPAFGGASITDVLAAVVKEEPDWAALPQETPAPIRRLLRRCLEKDPKRRLRDAADARLEIEDALAARTETDGAGVVPPSRTTAFHWSRALPWALTAMLVIVTASVLWRSRTTTTPAPDRVMRFAIALPSDQTIGFEQLGDIPTVALSPDGSRLVYVGVRDQTAQLYLRDMDRLDARVIAGTEGARGPFFSPDGQWVGFFAKSGMMKVPLGGGAPELICPSPPVSRGASWSEASTIIFAPQQSSGLAVVPASVKGPPPADAGGKPSTLGPDGLPLVTIPDAARGEHAHLWPEVLPGGKAVLFTIAMGANVDDSLIAVQSLETGERRTVITGGSQARYASSGHLIYARSGALLAVAFNLATLTTTGSPVTVVEGVRSDARTGAAQFGLSSSGSLAYVPGKQTSVDRTLLWVDRSGAAKPMTETRAAYSYVALAPDGRRLAFTMQGGGNQDVWIHDLERGIQSPLTLGPEQEWGAVWTPDSRRVIYSTHGSHPPNLYWMAADGSGTPERLTTNPNAQFAGAVSPDGDVLAFTQSGEKTAYDIWLLSLRGARDSRLLLGTPFAEYAPAFSPDGKWLAYVSEESGKPDVFVQPFPGPGAKRRVSTDGGVSPVWSRSTREIFYRKGTSVMSVRLSPNGELTPSRPEPLFEGTFDEPGLPFYARNYDVDRADRLVMVRGSDQPPANQVAVVINWSSELRRLSK